MAIANGIRTLLLAEGSVTALLGSATQGVYVGHAPAKATEPFVEIHELNDDRMVALDGTTGMRSTDIDIDCKAKTVPGAQALADAVEAYLDDYTGAAGSDTVNAVIQSDRSHDTEDPKGKREYPRSVETLDFQIQWTPA